MKIVSTAFLLAGLATLSACGGGAEENSAANAAGDDLYNVASEDLTLDNGLGNDLGNVSLNESDSNLNESANLSDGNSSSNSSTCAITISASIASMRCTFPGVSATTQVSAVNP